MAQKILVQDGNIIYAASDPAYDVNFGVNGQVNVTKQITVGDNIAAPGLISTPIGSGVDLIFRTNTDGVLNGNIKLEPVASGNILLNNVAWPDGTVAPVPGMYLGVSALNNLQFLVLPVPAASKPDYEFFTSSLGQTTFNTVMSTTAISGGKASLLVFVNGVKQVEGPTRAFDVTGTNQITFTSGLALDDEVEIYGFQ